MFGVSQIKEWVKRHPAVRQAVGRLIAGVPASVRMGRGFWRWYAFFQESERWSIEQHKAYQMDRLRSLLAELTQVSEFYRRRLDGVDIQKLDSLEQFSRLVPTLNREEFSACYNQIRSQPGKKPKLSIARTSGTTGNALQFYHTTEDDLREWAAICHQWSRVGYVPGRSRRVEFRGLTRPDSLVDMYPEQNMIRCSILHMKEAHVRHYADVIRKERAGFYHGYPSALYLLASTIIDSGIDFPQPHAVLIASEQVYEWQLTAIERAFPKAKLFAHYGCAERTVLGGWCEYRREYHVLPQYGLVEWDPETTEIIATNLFNTVNGFVRYRMTDTVLEVETGPCPDCGRPYVPRLIRLGGRSGDYLYSVEKGWIPPTIITFPLNNLRYIRGVQFRQSERKRINMCYTVRVPPDDQLVRAELSAIESGLHRIFGESTTFDFARVEDFPRSKSGKFRWIVNNLDEARFDSRG